MSEKEISEAIKIQLERFKSVQAIDEYFVTTKPYLKLLSANTYQDLIEFRNRRLEVLV